MAGHRQLIPDAEASAFDTWQAPVVEGPITSKLEDMPPKLPTAGEMQALQKAAYDEAYQLGRKEGREKAYQEGRKIIAEKAGTLQRLLAQLAAPLKELDEAMEQNIVALTLQIARHLVRRELKAEPGEVVAVVRECLSALPVSARSPRIYLHPEDAELVRQTLSLSDEERGWKIEDDLLMTRGDCRVETEASHIDASVDARLSAIAAQLLGGERDSDGSS